MIDIEKLTRDIKEVCIEAVEAYGTDILNREIKREDLHVEIHKDEMDDEIYIVCICDDFGVVIMSRCYNIEAMAEVVAYLIKSIETKMAQLEGYMKEVKKEETEETKTVSPSDDKVYFV